MRMAQAGARGAAHSAFLVMETVTGLGASSGYEGSRGSVASDAAEMGARAADSMASGAAATYQQAVEPVSGTSVPAGELKGPESTYGGYEDNVLRTAGVPGVGASAAPGDWAAAMVEQSAADEMGVGGAGGGAVGGEDVADTSKGSGAAGAGFASPSGGSSSDGGTAGPEPAGGISTPTFGEGEFGVPPGPASDLQGSGEAGPGPGYGHPLPAEGGAGGGPGGIGQGSGLSERATAEDEFGVSPGAGRESGGA